MPITAGDSVHLATSGAVKVQWNPAFSNPQFFESVTKVRGNLTSIFQTFLFLAIGCTCDYETYWYFKETFF